MHVSEVMTRNVEVIDSSAPLREAAGKMKTLDVGLIPVCDGDKLKGTLTDRDITVRGVAEGYDPSKTKVADIMSTDLAYCYEDDEIDAALGLMEKRQIRRLPVISRQKQLVGIVSLGDLAVHTRQKARVGETLEEVSQPATPRRWIPARQKESVRADFKSTLEMPKAIDRNEVQRLTEQGVQLVDVLPRKEYDSFHLPGAINLPLKLINHDTIQQLQKETAVIVYCYDYQ